MYLNFKQEALNLRLNIIFAPSNPLFCLFAPTAKLSVTRLVHPDNSYSCAAKKKRLKPKKERKKKNAQITQKSLKTQ